MNNIKARRLELNMTQSDLSKALKGYGVNIDYGMISRFECGACLPTETVLKALEAVLQTGREALLGADVPNLSGIDEPDSELDETTARIVNLIPNDKQTPIKRDILVEKSGICDRKVRTAIAKARKAGYLIINKSNGAGYYLSNDLDDIERQYRSDRRRALSVLSRLKKMRRILKEAGRNV